MSYAIHHDKVHIEILTPKQNTEKLDEDLASFSDKFNKVMQAGHIASITDNPMGHLSFQATEMIRELDLAFQPEQLLIHLNTFHTKQHLHEILDAAVALGARYLLAISGDGSERLPKLTPEDVGMPVKAVTSVELMKYISKAYPGKFTFGVAFNPYEPLDHEMEKMKRKVEAGAEFVITQPVIAKHESLDHLAQFKLPVIIDAWMSKKLHLLSECVGYTIPENTVYDPMANLRELRKNYPECGLYLALLGFKTQLPVLGDALRS